MTISEYERDVLGLVGIEELEDFHSLQARARLSIKSTQVKRIVSLRKMIRPVTTSEGDIETRVKAGTLDPQTGAEICNVESAVYYELADRIASDPSVRGLVFFSSDSPLDQLNYGRVKSSGSVEENNRFALEWANKADAILSEYLIEQS